MKGAVVVTDHAVLRWLERAEGIDVEKMRRGIAQLCAPAAAAGASKFSAMGITFIIKGNTVVTATPNSSPSTAIVQGARRNGGADPYSAPDDYESNKAKRRRGEGWRRGKRL